MPSGVKITDTGVMSRFDAAMRTIKKKSVNVGWFDTAVYPNGQQVAYVAAIQEFGSPEQNIPPRPFILPTYHDRKDEWRDILVDGAKAILENEVSTLDVLTQLGGLAAAEIQETITKVTDPPLSPVTIQNRLDRARLGLDATVSNIEIIRDEKGLPDKYLLDGEDIGLLAKPLIDTGLMLATCTFAVGKTRR